MFRKVLSGSLLIAGTTVGAGMLGIPLITAQAGFWPGVLITLLAWAIMLSTGLFFLEATLWMPEGSNLLSMSKRFLGNKGRFFSGAMFIFLYYCLLVAYFAAGAPMLGTALGLPGYSALSYGLFGLLFGLIIALGTKWIDRTNLILTSGLILSYFLLMGVGAPYVDASRFVRFEGKAAIFALPILFSAFGYHNIIPSLCTYYKKDKKILKASIVAGTLIALVIYLIWQWLVLGIIPQESIEVALREGKPVTAVLEGPTGNRWLFEVGQTFAFFALATSLLGVSFSMVDFLADGLKVDRYGPKRILLTLLTFGPPLILAGIYPTIFDQALGVAGGIGEALLNGIIPISLVWVGRYHKNLRATETKESSSKLSLITIGLIILVVMGIEILALGNRSP